MHVAWESTIDDSERLGLPKVTVRIGLLFTHSGLFHDFQTACLARLCKEPRNTAYIESPRSAKSLGMRAILHPLFEAQHNGIAISLADQIKQCGSGCGPLEFADPFNWAGDWVRRSRNSEARGIMPAHAMCAVCGPSMAVAASAMRSSSISVRAKNESALRPSMIGASVKRRLCTFNVSPC
jgi:hypothetical protein